MLNFGLIRSAIVCTWGPVDILKQDCNVVVVCISQLEICIGL